MKRTVTVLALTGLLTAATLTPPAQDAPSPFAAAVAEAAPSWQDCPRGYRNGNVRVTRSTSMLTRDGRGRLCVYTVERKSWRTLGLFRAAGYFTRTVR